MEAEPRQSAAGRPREPFLVIDAQQGTSLQHPMLGLANGLPDVFGRRRPRAPSGGDASSPWRRNGPPSQRRRTGSACKAPVRYRPLQEARARIAVLEAKVAAAGQRDALRDRMINALR